ncbi:SusD/RagB family nutrient-binding outer membrane lipoprotein [Chitinophaga oryziterrae]|uniref:SusD/RagB family nutrient-binding outer membrane lipoprotein n=1 Tax=Chitinophaga oryziterrae TaxID=1031224 RepID=A0A6N8JKJ0_9BACT|nr:SusD/RagB family nutrient-binding outer membrane lipoprotein [Chitinophaga oryziterrae]MVT44896.1 SusD/RagB family nutrient-binding outer membrane lipoprotein [Chitinophaga oryziterrae]
MKKIILMLSILLASCTKDFQEINTDPNGTPVALPQQLLAPALVSTLTYNMLRNRNFNNELMQVTVDPSDAEGKVFRYDYRATWADYLYNGWYSELTNFKDIYKIASQDLNYNKSYMGISLICQSWIYSMLTDTYGDVPYFQSNLAKDSSIYEPRFDKQKDIYLDIFKKLEEANTLLSVGTVISGSDPVYGGNVQKWRKFGNSLYLRLLLRLSGKAEVSDSCIAKIKEIAETNAANYPIIASNDESAILRWTGVGPYSSPYLSVREQDFRAPGLGSFFIDHLAAWNDPRIDIPTYGTNNINRWGIAPYSGTFQGIPSGYAPGENPVKKSYFYSNTSASSLMTEPLTGMMMNYAELKFILAEAAVKGWVSGSAETYYNDGALNSITQWIPTWPVNIKTFLSAADIEWIESETPDQKMEKIHLQKYYALFLTDMEQWFEYRRTGHPVLPQGSGLKNNGVMPARMTYPVYVQSTNPTNYKIAVAAQGPDEISTQVWWQKP